MRPQRLVPLVRFAPFPRLVCDGLAWTAGLGVVSARRNGDLDRVPLAGLLSLIAVGVVTQLVAGWFAGLYRLQRERRRRPYDTAERLIVFGAGDGGAQVVDSLVRTPSSGLVPVALIDDDPRKRLPPITELCHSHIDVEDIRPLNEVDLLGRRQIDLDVGSIAEYLQDRRVLVTGAGGSIGSELSRQIFRSHPLIRHMALEPLAPDVVDELDASAPPSEISDALARIAGVLVPAPEEVGVGDEVWLREQLR